MKKFYIILILLIAACKPSDDLPKGEISQNRSASFKSFMGEFSQIGKIANGDEPYRPEEFSQLVARFGAMASDPFQYFQSDPNGNGDALDSIWQNPQAFESKKQQFLDAVTQLNQAAQTQKLTDIQQAYHQVEDSCVACHRDFRRPK